MEGSRVGVVSRKELPWSYPWSYHHEARATAAFAMLLSGGFDEDISPTYSSIEQTGSHAEAGNGDSIANMSTATVLRDPASRASRMTSRQRERHKNIDSELKVKADPFNAALNEHWHARSRSLANELRMIQKLFKQSERHTNLDSERKAKADPPKR